MKTKKELWLTYYSEAEPPRGVSATVKTYDTGEDAFIEAEKLGDAKVGRRVSVFKFYKSYTTEVKGHWGLTWQVSTPPVVKKPRKPRKAKAKEALCNTCALVLNCDVTQNLKADNTCLAYVIK